MILPVCTAAKQSSSLSKTRAGPRCLNALGAGDLHDAAFGSEVAFQDDEAAGGLDGLVEGVNDDLAGSFDGELRLLRRESCR